MLRAHRVCKPLRRHHSGRARHRRRGAIV